MPERTPLGEHAYLLLRVDDVAAARAFYEQIGFQKTAEEGTLSDGRIHLRPQTGHFESPTLAYTGSDIDAVKAHFAPDKRRRKAKISGTAEFKSPEGIRITLDARKSKIDVPDRHKAQSGPLGMFGELTLPTRQLADSMVFWLKFAFKPLHMAQIPYPYAVMSDGLTMLGLHQSPQQQITLTYFAPDMPDRLAALKRRGIRIDALGTDASGAPTNGMLISPDGQVIFLLQGDVFGSA